MSPVTAANDATWAIAALVAIGVFFRPWRMPEAIWAVLGAAALVALSLVSWTRALAAVAMGTDVYLFLIGMMVLAELARTEGLFDWLAALAAHWARGSSRRLFTLVYVVGTVVTVFLSNDATAVVLTPAVYAAARAARAEPLPYLLICAFIANAASFVLPISNPANLVIFASHPPPLVPWLLRFTLPSAVAIVATFFVLRSTQRRSLAGAIARDVAALKLSIGGRLTAAGIILTAVVLLWASASGRRLGAPTFVAGTLTTAVVLLRRRESPFRVLAGISWGVLPLVAGLFVLVAGLNQTGLLSRLSVALQTLAHESATGAAWSAGIIVAVACNLVNNLPAALIAASAVTSAHVPSYVTSATLIGVDLGPNLSVTGSLATILWLAALRREGQHVSPWTFMRLGLLVMPPALVLALTAAILLR